MRATLATLLLIAAGSLADTASADPYRWCADYSDGQGGGGSSNCYFMTLEQCRATVWGAGGYCRPNPFYDGLPITIPPAQGAPRQRRRS